ncbi:FAD-dependent monooxygenase [bacterium]|nr:FAD-dependent monooxygenase [bacterium]
MKEKRIILIGAGLAGSLLAVYLAKRGFYVDIYERRPNMRTTKISAGRSINLALSLRGLHALQGVGLDQDILKIAIPMKGRLIHAPEGALNFIPYGNNDTEVIYSVSRGQLNMAMMDLAEGYDRVKIYFNKRCTGINFTTGEAEIFDETTGETSCVKAGTVIGTDGSASAIRYDMMKIGRFNYSQSYLEHGYKELSIPAGPGGKFLIEKNALHIWPRKTYMLIALPNLDGSFTCTLFFPMEGGVSFASLNTKEKVRRFFDEQFTDAVPLMPTLIEDFFSNPTSSLMTVKCFPWHVGHTASLLGDAAHAIVPFFGQGMNCSFEDCVVLDECVGRYGDDWEKIFSEYEALRKINTDAIADLAVENFYEMRDLVADPAFILKKKIEHVLEEKFPDRFVPKYSMVTFRRMPYSIALSRGKIQDTILSELAFGKSNVNEIDWNKAEKLVNEKLEKLI